MRDTATPWNSEIYLWKKSYSVLLTKFYTEEHLKNSSNYKQDWRPLSTIAGSVKLWIEIKISQIIAFCCPLGLFISITYLQWIGLSERTPFIPLRYLALFSSHACKKTEGKLDFLILSAKCFNPRKWASNGPRLLSAALASECDISPEDFAQTLSIGPGIDFNFISKKKDYL